MCVVVDVDFVDFEIPMMRVRIDVFAQSVLLVLSFSRIVPSVGFPSAKNKNSISCGVGPKDLTLDSSCMCKKRKFRLAGGAYDLRFVCPGINVCYLAISYRPHSYL